MLSQAHPGVAVPVLVLYQSIFMFYRRRSTYLLMSEIFVRTEVKSIRKLNVRKFWQVMTVCFFFSLRAHFLLVSNLHILRSYFPRSLLAGIQGLEFLI